MSLKVIAAMSGGVDSAVAAARAIDAGHDVVGVHLALSREPQPASGRGRGCCTISDAHDARRSADILGIPFYIWDMSDEFADNVVDDFIAEYAAGRTPNPCVRCNEKVKFAAVLDRAVELGFDAVCTGHYARLVDTAGGRELHRALDPEKDQSYVLGVLNTEQISRSMFPLGDSLKSEVRQEASRRGLLVAGKPDSHDICFIPDGNTSAWLQSKLGEATGDIVDAETGEVIGAHQGAYQFTVGQRRGLNIKTATKDGLARYVVGVDTATRTVSVGPPTLLRVNQITADQLRWPGLPVEAGARCRVQIRAHGEQIDAQIVEVDLDGEGSITVVVDEALTGVAAGQTIVLYDGTQVVGSATIVKTASRVSASAS